MSRGGPGLGQGRKALPPEEKKQTLSIRVLPDVIRELDELAYRFGKSRSEWANEALMMFLRRKSRRDR
jgi:predicted transcriptional regulator